MELKVIPFEYCSLARAAKFFNCEIEDFFHWYETKKISLSLRLSDHQATLLSINNKCVEFKAPYLGQDHVEYDQLSSADNEYSCVTETSVFVGHRLSYDHLGKIYRVSGHAHDFWKPCDAFIEALRRGGRIMESFSASPYGFDKDFRIMVKVSDGIQTSDPDSPLMYYYPEFKLEDIVLRKEDLNVINHLICGIEISDESHQIESRHEIHDDNNPQEQEQILEWNDFKSKDTSLKFIAGMALALQKASPKFRNGSKINRSSIAKEAISLITKQGIKFDITERQLTNLMNQAIELYGSKDHNID